MGRVHDRYPFQRPFRKGAASCGSITAAAGSTTISRRAFLRPETTRSGPLSDWRPCGGTASCRIDAGDEAGVLRTRPVIFPGRELRVNADASRGSLQVEIITVTEDPDPSCWIGASVRRAACGVRPLVEPALTADSTDCPVRWTHGTDISGLSGRLLAFRFHLRNASLYSFWISTDVEPPAPIRTGGEKAGTVFMILAHAAHPPRALPQESTAATSAHLALPRCKTKTEKVRSGEDRPEK